MSTLRVNTIENNGSAVDLPQKLKIGGASIEQGYTSSGSEPGSPSTGDFWWDSTNEKLYRYIDGGFKEISIAGGMSAAGFFSRASARWSNSAYHSDDWMLGKMTKQASDGSYYTVGQQIYSTDSGWLMKRDSDGVFQWIRAWGNDNMRPATLLIDSSDNPICLGTDYGYGNNASGGSPQTGYILKFNPSGVKQYGHTFRFSTFSSNYNQTGLNRASAMDSHGNIWATFLYDDNLTSPQNYSHDVIGLVQINSSTGALKKVYTLPPSGTSVRCISYDNAMHIDENDNMYIGWAMYDANATSYPHGVVVKMDIPSADGAPTYTWTKRYGTNAGSTHYDVPYRIDKLSTGEVIVAGYERKDISGTNRYIATLMSLSDTDGSTNWAKSYDHTYMEGTAYGMAIDGQDKIFLAGAVDGGVSGTGYNFYAREINSSNGAHVANSLYQFDPTGDPNHTFQSGTSYSATSTWRWGLELGSGVNEDYNGNVIVTTNLNGNGFDYRPCLIKFPSALSAGTFGTQTGSYAGNLQIIANSATPTDYTYSPSALTYASFSTITDITSSFTMDTNYNSGSANDTVFTPTSDGITHNAAIS